MAPFPVDTNGGDGQGCANLCAGGTPALPGGAPVPPCGPLQEKRRRAGGSCSAGALTRPAFAASRPPSGATRRQGQKGNWAKGNYSLSRRKPRSLARLPGEYLSRFADRQFPAMKSQPPPRKTRYEPDRGPLGSTTAPPG